MYFFMCDYFSPSYPCIHTHTQTQTHCPLFTQPLSDLHTFPSFCHTHTLTQANTNTQCCVSDSPPLSLPLYLSPLSLSPSLPLSLSLSLPPICPFSIRVLHIPFMCLAICFS